MPEKIFVKSDDEVSTFLDSSIKTALFNRNSVVFGEVFNANNMTECNRRILYRTFGVKADNPISNEFIWREEIIKQKWINLISSIPHVRFLEKNRVVSDASFYVTGIIDGIFKIGNKVVIVDISSINHKEFEKINSNGPIRKNIVKIMLKMWMSEIKHSILIHEHNDNGKFKIFHVTPFKPIIDSVCNKCAKNIQYKLHGKLPDREYLSNDCAECNVCEFNLTCWKG